MIWSDNREVYGRPRIHAELRAQGERVGNKRVARLMKQAGIEGASRRRSAKTTRRDADRRPAPDLVDRDFSAAEGDRLCMSGAAASILAPGPLQGRYFADIGRLRDVRSVRPARSGPLSCEPTSLPKGRGWNGGLGCQPRGFARP